MKLFRLEKASREARFFVVLFFVRHVIAREPKPSLLAESVANAKRYAKSISQTLQFNLRFF